MTRHDQQDALERDAWPGPFDAMTDAGLAEMEAWLDSIRPALDAEAALERMRERERLERGWEDGGGGEFPY